MFTNRRMESVYKNLPYFPYQLRITDSKSIEGLFAEYFQLSIFTITHGYRIFLYFTNISECSS